MVHQTRIFPRGKDAFLQSHQNFDAIWAKSAEAVDPAVGENFVCEETARRLHSKQNVAEALWVFQRGRESLFEQRKKKENISLQYLFLF